MREVAQAVGTQLREGDLLGRVGGEEFLVLLPQTDLAAAQPLAERLRQILSQTTISDRGETVALPASFGIAELRPRDTPADWFRRADHALYEAKAQGRNRVVMAD